MQLLAFLVVFPLAVAVLQLLPSARLRTGLTWGGALVIMAASIGLLWRFSGAGACFFELDSRLIQPLLFGLDVLITAVILVCGWKHGRWPAVCLGLLQFAVIVVIELGFGDRLAVSSPLFVDQLSVIMAVIIGVIGSLICIYSLGYMREYHEQHAALPDRRPMFFSLLFVFLGAMFGLVFANSLAWMAVCWEITTLCSFLLIGYSGTDEAISNAFKALNINLLGGLAFMLAMLYLVASGQTLALNDLLASPQASVLLPVALLSLAGLTKAAQLPFSSWLVGAMVAPTPTSALLHSSTMVKAGVYLVIRLSPQLSGNAVGRLVALTGALTFVIAAFIAVSQSNAKKVLAYSTISNLGLIVICAGVGSPAALWAGIFLIIFHAAAKSLLFLGVGSIEQRLGSRDIEVMDNLILKLPLLTLMVVIGICGMFLAPFGMLVSKWAAIEAFADFDPVLSPILLIILAYGSAVTVFFWTKWLGKLLMVNRPYDAQLDQSRDQAVPFAERLALALHAVIVLGLTLGFPLISLKLVEPWLEQATGSGFSLAASDWRILVLMVVLVNLLPLLARRVSQRRRVAVAPAYLGGRSATPERSFAGSLGLTHDLTLKNYYLERFFGEALHLKIGQVLCGLTVSCMLGAAFL